MRLPLSKEADLILSRIGKIADLLQVRVYVVGGFVRDMFLGREAKDIDIVCVDIDAYLIAEQYKLSFRPHSKLQYFKNYGVTRLQDGDFSLEFVHARKESYSPESRNPQVCSGTFAEDQARRDFTVNALAASLNQADYAQVVDSFNGMEDLERAVLRTPRDPHITFSDDPLRIFRAARFAAQLDFSIDEATLDGMWNNRQRVEILAKERITEELNKILLSDQPSIGLLYLDNVGVLEQILPELTALKGVEFVDGKGHKDNFYHSLQVLDNIAPKTQNLYLRWTALLHDIGKTYTKRFQAGIGWTFHMHELVGAKMVFKLFKRLRLSLGEPLKYVQKLISLHHRPISLTRNDITDAALRRLLFEVGADLEDLMSLCAADLTSKNQRKVQQYQANFREVQRRIVEVEERDRICNFQPPIDGQLIMETFAISPGPIVGIIKNKVREAILDARIANTKEAAWEYMHQIAPEILQSGGEKG